MAQRQAEHKLERPVGIVLDGKGVLLRTVRQSAPIQALPGVLLFPDDTLENAGGAIEFVLCSDRKKRALAPGGKASIGNGTVTGGEEKPETVAFCMLPSVDREPLAGDPQFEDDLPVPPPGEETLDLRLRALTKAEHGEFTPVEQALGHSSGDLMARVAHGMLLEKYKLNLDAWEEYHSIAEEWPGAVWARAKAQEVRPPKPPPAVEGPGKTYALVVGVSKYEFAGEDFQNLYFADKDAESLRDFLASPRGGDLGNPNRNPDDLLLRVEEAASPNAVRRDIQTLFDKAAINDTVVLFFAAHGKVKPTETDKGTNTRTNPQGFILTSHSNPEDLKTSALAMSEILGTVVDQMEKTRHVLLYLDLCHAGQIGVINRQLELLASAKPEALGILMASAPSEPAFESEYYGGGHGAFTYFLLRGLNGDADQKPIGNEDGSVTSLELADYVKRKVAEATRNKQHPRELFLTEITDPMAKTSDSPGIPLKDWSVPPEGWFPESNRKLTSAARVAPRGTSRPEPAAGSPANDPELRFDLSLRAGRLRADEPESASAALDDLRQDPNPVTRQRIRMFQARLQVALEDRGDTVLLKYLKGDQEGGNAKEFLEGALDFEAALRLAPGAQFDESRGQFCRGRALIFEKQYERAVELLEQAIRLDPTRAYAYNALGIAYLEQVSKDTRYYQYATEAFQDAIRRAPYWAYPRHNLALAYTQRGEFQRAAAEYRAAMDVGPSYSYLPYNLGLLYQEIADFPQAKVYYRKAMEVASKRCELRLGKGFTACPERSLPQTGLASLEIRQGNRRRARKLLNAALKDDPGDLTAAHDKAAILADWRGHEGEAETIWLANLKRDAAHLPSLIGYSDLLSRGCRFGEAVPLYRAILKQIPDYVPAQIGLARALAASGALAEAGPLTEALVAQRSQNAQAWAARAEYLSRTGASSDTAWQNALRLAKDGAERKQIAARRKGGGCL